MRNTLSFIAVLAAVACVLAAGCGRSRFGVSPLDLTDAQVLRLQRQAASATGAPAAAAKPPENGTSEISSLPGRPTEAAGPEAAVAPPSAPAPAAPAAKRAENLAEAAAAITADLVALEAFLKGDSVERVMVDDTLLAGAAASGPAFPGGLAKRLRVELNRAANGKIYFVSLFLSGIEKQRGRAAAAWELRGAVADVSPPLGEPDPTAHWRELTLSLVGAGSTEIAWQGRFRFRNGR